jgi:hypothetical protein
MPFGVRPWILLLAAIGQVHAGPYTKTKQSSRLYTPPDPSASGGLLFRLPARSSPLAGVFALPQLDPSLCYQAEINGREGRFRGLPVGRYDLIIVYHDIFYENILLTQDPDTLTPSDHEMIRQTIEKAVPFFNVKTIHRLAGQTGRGGKAALVLQDLRTLPVTLQDASVRKDIQIRSLKLARLEQVNIGWQLVHTREIIRMEVGPDMPQGVLPYRHVPALGNIRVTDTVRDLGELQLPP